MVSCVVATLVVVGLVWGEVVVGNGGADAGFAVERRAVVLKDTMEVVERQSYFEVQIEISEVHVRRDFASIVQQ